MQALRERGERLAHMQDQSHALRDDSTDFANNVRLLRQRMQNKKWYQL